MYEIIDNDEFRDLCFYQTEPKKVTPFLLGKKDKLPIAISDSAGTYYLTKNKYLGFGYWNPSSYDPNVFCHVEYKRGATAALKAELNECLASFRAFYY